MPLFAPSRPLAVSIRWLYAAHCNHLLAQWLIDEIAIISANVWGYHINTSKATYFRVLIERGCCGVVFILQGNDSASDADMRILHARIQ
jgi:hypothetical protein